MDGSGKSTQISKLKEYLEESGYDVILSRARRDPDRRADTQRDHDPANRGDDSCYKRHFFMRLPEPQHVHDVIACSKRGKDRDL